jgi:hypothetical protein
MIPPAQPTGSLIRTKVGPLKEVRPKRFSYKRIGGMRFVSLYSIRINWCVSRKSEYTIARDIKRLWDWSYPAVLSAEFYVVMVAAIGFICVIKFLQAMFG